MVGSWCVDAGGRDRRRCPCRTKKNETSEHFKRVFALIVAPCVSSGVCLKWTCAGPACVHISAQAYLYIYLYTYIFLCSDELNHSSTLCERGKKADEYNTLCCCCTRWELNGERNVMTEMGGGVCWVELVYMCVCVRLCVQM